MKAPDEITYDILTQVSLGLEETRILSVEIAKAIQAERYRAEKLVVVLERIHKGLTLGVATTPKSYAAQDVEDALKEYRGEK